MTAAAPFVLADAIAQKERELYALRSELARQRASSYIPAAEAVLVRCRLGEHNVAFLASEVSEVLRMAELSTIPDAPVWFMGLLAIGSQRIPVIDLFARQTGRCRAPDPSELIVLTQTRSGLCGLVVDEVAELVTVHGSQVFRPAPDAPFGAHVLGTVSVRNESVLLLSAAPLSLEDVDLANPSEVTGVKATVAIEHKLSSLLGLKLRPNSGHPLERALQRVRDELGFAPEEVALRLEREPWLVKRLAGALTVDETFFLRHPEHFEALTTHARERLYLENRRLVLWSAGCAGGEEPYSMAIAIHHALGESALSRTQILANDISEAALGRAKRGVYGPWSFRGAEHLTRTTYFESNSRRDECRLRPPALAAVTFRHNAVEQELCELAPKSVDAVFFRNVAIYLTDDALRRIYAGLFAVLRDDAILVLSPADPRPSPDRFAVSHIGDVLVYRKRTTRGAATSGVIHAVDTTRSQTRSDAVPRAPRGHDAHDAHTAADRSLATHAQQLADCGLLGDALSVLDRRLELGPSSAGLLALRGRVQLASGHAEASERDLRAALAMLPDQPLVRFHHALALETLQQRGACCLELRQLLTSLETRNDSERLDESTSVKSLRQATQELLRRME